MKITSKKISHFIISRIYIYIAIKVWQIYTNLFIVEYFL